MKSFKDEKLYKPPAFHDACGEYYRLLVDISDAFCLMTPKRTERTWRNSFGVIMHENIWTCRYENAELFFLAEYVEQDNSTSKRIDKFRFKLVTKRPVVQKNGKTQLETYLVEFEGREMQ